MAEKAGMRFGQPTLEIPATSVVGKVQSELATTETLYAGERTDSKSRCAVPSTRVKATIV